MVSPTAIADGKVSASTGRYSVMSEPKTSRKKITRDTPQVDSIDSAEEQIEYMIGLCSYGSILLATSSKGVCAVFLGDHPDALFVELRQQFPEAEFIAGDDKFEQLLVEVINFVESPDKELDLALDIRGSSFQRAVWAALMEIPYGETCTYTELAMRIGSPSAVRAVAQACAANRIAVIIPCHRVVRLDGDLSGYRWGTKRKQRLLEKEQN